MPKIRVWELNCNDSGPLKTFICPTTPHIGDHIIVEHKQMLVVSVDWDIKDNNTIEVDILVV